VGEKTNASRVLVRNPVGKSTQGISRSRWEDNIKMDLKEIGWDGMDWIRLVQDRNTWRSLEYTVMNFRIP
jgi:hypothetical protein